MKLSKFKLVGWNTVYNFSSLALIALSTAGLTMISSDLINRTSITSDFINKTLRIEDLSHFLFDKAPILSTKIEKNQEFPILESCSIHQMVQKENQFYNIECGSIKSSNSKEIPKEIAKTDKEIRVKNNNIIAANFLNVGSRPVNDFYVSDIANKFNYIGSFVSDKSYCEVNKIEQKDAQIYITQCDTSHEKTITVIQKNQKNNEDPLISVAYIADLKNGFQEESVVVEQLKNKMKIK